MVASGRLEAGVGGAAVGVAVVLCSVVGLQLGWLSAGLLGGWDAVPAALLAGGGIAFGFWLGSRRDWFSERE